MADVIPFPTPTTREPMDDIAILCLEINGKGEIDLQVNSYCETVEQHNWLIAKLTEAASHLVSRKKALQEKEAGE